MKGMPNEIEQEETQRHDEIGALRERAEAAENRENDLMDMNITLGDRIRKLEAGNRHNLTNAQAMQDAAKWREECGDEKGDERIAKALRYWAQHIEAEAREALADSEAEQDYRKHVPDVPQEDDMGKWPDQPETREGLYVCESHGDGAECVVVRGLTEVQRWVRGAMLGFPNDTDPPEDVVLLEQSVTQGHEWEDGCWEVRFEDGSLRVREIDRVVDYADQLRHSPPPQGNAMEELVSLVEELCERIDHDAEDIGSRARPVGELVPLLGPAVNKARRALAAHKKPDDD